jgi:hypothetical protein
MRTWNLVACLLLLSLAAIAQQSPLGQNATNNSASGGTGAVTVVGCVNSLNGYFTLETRGGEVYRLKGDHDALLGRIGKQVAISGTMTGSKKAQTLKISTMKKISDTCQ